MKELKFDLVAIGGGAGGLFAASVAKALGAKTCIVEKARLGGDCTWLGCMPSKALLKSAHVAHCVKEALRFGLEIQNPLPLNANKVMAHVRSIVSEIATHHEPQDFQKRGIEIILGPPRFINPHTLEVNGSQILAKRFVICTGSHPVIPPIDGLKDISYLTNENIFDLNELPKSLIVLGGGPIGCELSQALCRLGVQVSLVEMFDRILFREDPEVSKFVEDQFKEDGIVLYAGKKAMKFSKENGDVSVWLQSKDGKTEKIAASKVLVAVGRAPNVQGLDLEKANVEYTPKGLKLNEYLQTTNSNIFACGDIASPYQFSHVAAYQASVAVRNCLFKRIAWQKVNYDNVTWATFTEPQLAHLGLTEEEARQKYKNVRVYTTPYINSDRSVTDVETKGLVKIIIDKKGFILGAHIAGTNADEIMQGLLVAKSQKIPLVKIAQTMFIYPTLSELIKKTAAKPLVEMLGNNPLLRKMLNLLKSF